MKITIIGAGMAGLVAANMLRRHDVEIIERGEKLPHNHTALLRFRTTAVSDATGIPFQRETVHKGLWDGEKVVNTPTIAHLNRYSAIVTNGELHNRSIFNLASAERWVAPVDFVDLMARNLKIEFNRDFSRISHICYDEPVISTVAMPFMMKMFGWPDPPDFKYLPVWTLRATIFRPISNICQTLYNTELEVPWYRATIHGQQLTLEFMHEPSFVNGITGPLMLAKQAIDMFFNHKQIAVLSSEDGVAGWIATNGFVSAHITDIQPNKIPIGKIRPIEEKVRKAFMIWLTDKYNIYSLGRFACWRNILLDDVVQDVKRIEAMIEAGTTYEMRKA
jgi:hypothetical protein